MNTLRLVAMVGLCAITLACGGPQFGRTGRPLSLPNGAPRNSCEREQWYELAPARVNMVIADGTVMYTQIHEGAGVFQAGEDEPMLLEDLWPKMQENELMRKHQARIDVTDKQIRKAVYWGLAGIGGFGLGLGVGLAVRDESKTTSDVLIATGIGIGAVGLLTELLLLPSPEERLTANARRVLFKPREDDLTQVARGVEHANSERRRECGGVPVPFDVGAVSEKPASTPGSVTVAPADQ